MRDPASRRMQIYLNDHLLGASGGTRLARRVAAAQRGTPLGRELHVIADEIAEDYEALIQIMRQVGVAPRRVFAMAGQVGELVGRLKPNGRLVRGSRLKTLVELEAMRLGVLGKAQGWAALAVAAESEPRLDRELLRMLLDRATRQAEALEAMRLSVADMLAVPYPSAASRDTSANAGGR